MQLTCFYRGAYSKSEVSSSPYEELIIALTELALTNIQKM